MADNNRISIKVGDKVWSATGPYSDWEEVDEDYPYIGGDTLTIADIAGDLDYGTVEEGSMQFGAVYPNMNKEFGQSYFSPLMVLTHWEGSGNRLCSIFVRDGKLWTYFYGGYREIGDVDIDYTGPINGVSPITAYSIGTTATDEQPTPPAVRSHKLYRKRGNRLDELAVKDKDAEWDKAGSAPIGYDKTNDTLVPLKDMSLNSINVVDRIVVEGISYLNGDVIADKNVSVHGDLIVDGTTYTTEEQSLDTTSDYVVLRHSNPSGLSNTEKAGIVVNNYNGTKHAALAVDNDGIWRVSDNETESTTTYTNFSKYGDTYYEGFDQTTTKQVITNGATVSRDADELSDCVWYDGHYYYHDNVDWFLLSLTSNRMVFDVDSPITDEALITTLNGLTKANLEYYRSVTILTISDVSETQVVVGSHKCYTKFVNGKAYANEDNPNASGTYLIYFLTTYEVDPETGTPNKEPAFLAGSDQDRWVYYDNYYWKAEDWGGGDYRWSRVTGIGYTPEDGNSMYLTNRTLDPLDPDDLALMQTLNALPEADELPIYINTDWTETETVENNQPLLTRAESEDLTDGAPLVWDSQNNKAITTATTDGNKVLKSVKDTTTGKVTYEWSSSGSGAVWVGTSAQLQQALLIVDPNDERYIPDNAMLIITDNKTVYLHGEVEENA